MAGLFERFRSSDEGMTLLELVIAAVILLFSISAVFGLLITATRMSVQSKEQNIATAAANSYLERVRSISYDVVGVVGGAGGSIEGTLPAVSTVVNGSFVVTITPTVTWIDDPTIFRVDGHDYKEVRIAVVVGAGDRAPLTRTFATYVRAPGEIQAITGETSDTPGGDTAVEPVVEWVEGETPEAGATVRGSSIVVTVRASTPNTGGTIKRVQMFCGVPVLFGTGGGIPANFWTTGEWIDLNVASGKYVFTWNTLAKQEDGVTRWYPDGQRKLYVTVYDNQSRTGTIERWVDIDNDPPGALSSPPVPTRGANQEIVVSWGAALNGTGVTDWATIYEFFPYRDVPSASGAGAPPAGWNGITHWEVTPGSPGTPSYTWTGASAFSRYWFQMRAENDVNLHGPLANETAVPVVTRPKIKGTYTNAVPSNNKIQSKVNVSVSGPTFTTTAISYQLWRSTDRVNWSVAGAASTTPSLSYDTGVLNANQFGSFYYKVVATFTPGGTKNAVSQTVETKVIGPVPANGPSSGTLSGSDVF